jgi:hypothetical protein
MYQTLQLRITGVSPILLHNGHLADPLEPIVKEIKKISGKRGKTDADLEELARLEWRGSLYLNDGKVCLPGDVIEAAFCEGAKRSKSGKLAQAGIICPTNPPLEYDGPSDIDDLWKDGGFRLTVGVKIQRSRVMRTRPIFRKWAVTFGLMFDDGLLNREQVIEIMKTTGEVVGICDWRPKFGRFGVEVLP